jgi:translation initiation factor IF-2
MNASSSHNPTVSSRPPVVAVFGHIDHGKSTLLDYVRKSNITDKETGGITQNMSAYEVVQNDTRITFLDTPGHEAFQELRSRGAKVADIGILVVSAEDGVKPQTLEAYKAITEASLPVIVAINKIDKPSANIERTKQNLLEGGIYLEGYGGSIPSVPISAITGEGIPDLLDMIKLLAEVEDFKADAKTPAEGIVLETNRDKQRGISATLIIKNGTLETGMYVVAGGAMAPVRVFEDCLGKPIKEATFSSPVKVTGFDELPTVGDFFTSYSSKKEAEAAVAKNHEDNVVDSLPRVTHAQSFLLPAVIKANTSGVLEAIAHEMKKCETEKTGINIVSQGIGDISESDIKLAAANLQTLIIGFDNKIDGPAKALAEKLGMEVKIFNIIYKLSEWLTEVIAERTPKVEVEEERGTIKVLKIFSKTKDKQVVGGRVENGAIAINDEVVIYRREAEIGRGRVRELQQAKAKTSEVKEGSEFGSMIESKIEIAPGDYLKPIMKVVK